MLTPLTFGKNLGQSLKPPHNIIITLLGAEIMLILLSTSDVPGTQARGLADLRGSEPANQVGLFPMSA